METEVILENGHVQRVEDPHYSGAERHTFMVPALDVPENIPTDPNPRAPRVDRPVWREIKRHLLNDEGTPNVFHLKNKGITAIAESVERDGEIWLIKFKQGQGIVDGGHTYQLLKEAKQEILDIIKSSGQPGPKPVEQYVKVDVLTGIPLQLVPEIARGLNTSIQVQEMSLMELQHDFDWIKRELEGTPYAHLIAWREGDNAPEDARTVITLLDLFNVEDFPNNGQDYPIRAYTAKAQVLANYKRHPEHYKPLRPILRDILLLHDLIEFGSPMFASRMQQTVRTKLAQFPFIEERKRGIYHAVFTDQESRERIFGGALFPILGAFRWLVEMNPQGEAQWRGGFGRVLKIWEKYAEDMMRSTMLTAEELGRKPYAIGRSRNHWASLHSLVAKADLSAPEGWNTPEGQTTPEALIKEQQANARLDEKKLAKHLLLPYTWAVMPRAAAAARRARRTRCSVH